MQVIENNELFTQVAAEESSVVSGGTLLNFAIFSFFATSPASFGGTDYTVEEFILAIAILSQPENFFNPEIAEFGELINV
ncbi:hypothetical protein PN497_23310 [Sphaerospermopsis kisseleviana CS-549]|uniref:Uncharacterized protein n=1 Tax=Sphaerospermopsis kisseleviana CS-549 TaxID=3021783 RepID=A0ABT4ZXU5_9CYAN|nr:hypothetical protein [Sphaerospermopsis kisseleviana]MDB9444258.1 hypothetical protein [Sphaerospermopsis kisseleviana CS-549]BAZ80067.1 hypothetical protein NIES73_13150 [Sphaerospermopsis kisseleviana NIES-73]